jgi:hypothetical protein
MELTEKFRRMKMLKFSFGKATEFSEKFAKDCDAFSMYDNEFGLSIPGYLSEENKLRAVFRVVMESNGQFLFNISGVNLRKARKGFTSFREADENNQITEWELFMILRNRDYKKNCTFHNGKTAFKKTMLWRSITG